MSLLQPLAPPSRSERAVLRKHLGFAFGDRFFILLIAGLLWIGPLFWSFRFIFGLVAWDVVLLCVWLLDLRRLRAVSQITVERAFTAPLALEERASIRLTLTNTSALALRIQLLDDAPTQLRLTPPELTLFVPGGQERTVEYKIAPGDRGDYEIGKTFLRCQTALSLAQRWAEADLRQKVRVYPSLQSAKRNELFLLRSRRVELERRLLRHHVAVQRAQERGGQRRLA